MPFAAKPPRLLMATEFWHGSTGRSLAQGFREAGCDVAEIDVRHFTPVARGAVDRAIARATRVRSNAAYNAHILSDAEWYRPHALVTVKGSCIAADTLRALRAKGVLLVNYYPDVAFGHHNSDPGALPLYDLIVTTKSYQVAPLTLRFGAERIAFVHHGHAPTVHAPRHAGAVPYRWDVSHIGNASPYKADYLIAVAERFPRCRIAVFGHRWEALARGTALEPFVIGHPVIGDFFARAIEESRINIAIHFGPVPPDGWQDLTSTRTFEIPASGGFMLHVDNPEVRALFDVPGEIDVFSTPEQLCAKIAHYLDHEEERLAMTQRAHARCVPAYSYHARAAEIAALIEARLS